MKICNIPLIKLNKNNTFKKQNTVLRPLKNDVFVKQSTPSFKGKSTSDNEFSVLENTIMIYEDILRSFLDISAEASHKTAFERMKNLRINEFLDFFEREGMDATFLKGIFKQTGISSVFLFQRYLKTYSSSELKRIFNGQEIEQLWIYSLLDSKDDLSKYGELLLYLYDSCEDDEDIEVYLNKVTSFLKQTGLNNFKDFDEKFAHLKSDFNDFQNISDKNEAIEYLMTSYPDKINFINEILSKNTSSKNINAEKIYFLHSDIIDYLYEKNNGKSLEPLADFLNCFLSDKIKKPALNRISEYFNEFSTPEDKVDFYKFLAENDVLPEDFNSLASGIIISDNSILDHVKNKTLFVKEISSIKDIDNTKALETYKQFSDVANSLYSKDEANNSRLKAFFDIAELFNIRNSYSLLELYNNINGTKNKSITSQECKDFIDTMTFCFSNKIFQEAKSKKVKPLDIINLEKERFLSIKDDIEDYIAEKQPISLLGLSSRDIYIKYRKLLKENLGNVKSVLENVIQLNIENSAEYKKKTTKLENLSKYFSSNDDLFSFIKQAKIKLDGQREDEEYIENCQNLLETLKNNASKEEYDKFIQYIIQSDFLAKSKNSLGDFLSEYGKSNEISDLFLLITDKKIPSTEDFMDFISANKDSDDKYDNLLAHLANTPDNIDFQGYIKALNLVKSKIKETKVPVKIDNTNIHLIDMDTIAGKNDLPPKLIVTLLNKLSGTDEHTNFISKFENSYTDKDGLYASFDIANEIVGKEYSQDNKYSNIIKLFKLSKRDLGLSENCAYYIYVKAMAHALPINFINFINSHDWLKLQEDAENFPNISLHAKLRLIDRFALQNCKTAQELYEDSTKEYIRDILKSIYIQNPDLVTTDKDNKNTVTITQHNTESIKSVFGKNGRMVTIIALGR